MRTLFLAFAAFSFCMFSHAQNSEAQNIGASFNTTRYIIFSGTYTVASDARPSAEQGVFRLDTYSGKTWRLKVERKAGGQSFEWVPVEDAERTSPDTTATIPERKIPGHEVIKKDKDE